MKAIVEAAKKAGVELKADDVDGAAGDAGRLFANGAAVNADDEAEGAAEKAGEAVSAVSGDQILKAIVDAAESTAGKGANTATNAVEAAIGGGAAAEFTANMKKNQIAAAIVLRGLAKDGKFANANAAGGNGKVKAAVNADQAQGAAEKAGEAVSAVSGDQILKAIVDAAESTEGKRANEATNAVEAAIGGDNAGAAGEGAAFTAMKKKNQIAAAIVLRGLAKDGKFANTNDAANGAKVKAAVKSAVER